MYILWIQARRPKDASLHVKLLRLYMDTGRVNEAYTHILRVEERTPFFNSLEWYQCFSDVLEVKHYFIQKKCLFKENILLLPLSQFQN